MRPFRRKAAGGTPRRYYNDREVKIAELVEWHQPVLRNAVFERCQILGPAILAPDSGTVFKDCGFHFEASAEEVLWEAPPRAVKSGCIAVENCTFRKCTFASVGIAGGPKLIARFRKIAKASGDDADATS